MGALNGGLRRSLWELLALWSEEGYAAAADYHSEVMGMVVGEGAGDGECGVAWCCTHTWPAAVHTRTPDVNAPSPTPLPATLNCEVCRVLLHMRHCLDVKAFASMPPPVTLNLQVRRGLLLYIHQRMGRPEREAESELQQAAACLSSVSRQAMAALVSGKGCWGASEEGVARTPGAMVHRPGPFACSCAVQLAPALLNMYCTTVSTISTGRQDHTSVGARHIR